MKAITFCLLMLLLVATFAEVVDWTGTWFHGGGNDAMCLPTGLLTIKQDSNGKATIEGFWDEYSPFCNLDIKQNPKLKVQGVAQDKELNSHHKKLGIKRSITRLTSDS